MSFFNIENQSNLLVKFVLWFGSAARNSIFESYLLIRAHDCAKTFIAPIAPKISGDIFELYFYQKTNKIYREIIAKYSN